jgi:hypothetical protein
MLAGIRAEPLAVWDVREDGPLFWRHWHETHIWAMAHLAAASSTYRVEFYLLDAPFAAVWRYALNEDGREVPRCDVALAEPGIEMLDELPPAHLLGR